MGCSWFHKKTDGLEGSPELVVLPMTHTRGRDFGSFLVAEAEVDQGSDVPGGHGLEAMIAVVIADVEDETTTWAEDASGFLPNN